MSSAGGLAGTLKMTQADQIHSAAAVAPARPTGMNQTSVVGSLRAADLGVIHGIRPSQTRA